MKVKNVQSLLTNPLSASLSVVQHIPKPIVRGVLQQVLRKPAPTPSHVIFSKLELGRRQSKCPTGSKNSITKQKFEIKTQTQSEQKKYISTTLQQEPLSAAHFIFWFAAAWVSPGRIAHQSAKPSKSVTQYLLDSG